MSPTRDPSGLAELEGRQVSVALDDGSRIDDCQLVSYRRHNVATVWLFVDGADLFLRADRIIEMWEAQGPAAGGPLRPEV